MQTMDKSPSYQVRVSKRFLVLSLLSCILVAFVIGRTVRVKLILAPQKHLLQQLVEQNVSFERRDAKHVNDYVMKLPNPVLGNGKQIPKTLYTSKNFDTARSATINSRWVVTEDEGTTKQCLEGSQNEFEVSDPVMEAHANAEEDEEIYLPVGQHLLLDIRNVDSVFLGSEERLAKAMLNVVNDCGLTLLSYHCHGLEPSGVSCVGVLLESHVSFHTWPNQGVITLDLFTCGSNSLLPVVSTAERFFGIPDASANPKSPVEKPESVWAYKQRGFGADDEDTIAGLTDLFAFPIGEMTDYKKQVSPCHY
jgi:S-adenosylmethionine decarboxylase proenzyme